MIKGFVYLFRVLTGCWLLEEARAVFINNSVCKKFLHSFIDILIFPRDALFAILLCGLI